MPKEKRLVCEVCGKGVRMEGHAAYATRVYWCPGCSVNATLAVRMPSQGGLWSLAVFTTDGRPPRFHALEDVERRRASVLAN